MSSGVSEETRVYLSKEEVDDLIVKIKAGDDEAWTALQENFKDYVRSLAKKRLVYIGMSEAEIKNILDDMIQAGWYGLIDSMKSYDSKVASFITYTTSFIEGELSKELEFQLNTMGLAEKPKTSKMKDKSAGAQSISRIEIEDALDLADAEVARAPIEADSDYNIDDAPDLGPYSEARRTLQLLEVLKQFTDDEHPLSKDFLGARLKLYRIAKHQNGTPLEDVSRTLTATLEEMLAELDPMEYNGANEDDYKIKYEGYEEDRLRRKINKEFKKAPSISKFSYTHTFSNVELDQLIQLVCFSDMLSQHEKTVLVKKLVGTASIHYKTPFWDGSELKFNPRAIYGRFSQRSLAERVNFAKNLKIIQQAVNNLWQIRFHFNKYNEDGELELKNNFVHTISPYHLVVYHDNYYCIGLNENRDGSKKVMHYRVDMMSDIEIYRDDEGNPKVIKISPFEGLPIFNSHWDPEEYMSEHLNMAFDEPDDILIKVPSTDPRSYTILHDWFGEHFEKIDPDGEIYSRCLEEGKVEEGYDIVRVRTSPFMIVHWAASYAGMVEVLNEDIREKIRHEAELLTKKYN